MSWLGLLLVGVALTDLSYSATSRGRLAEGVGAASAVVLGLLGGLTEIVDLAALAGVAVVVVIWGESVSYAFRTLRYVVPLAVLATAVGGVVLASGAAPEAGGPLHDWLASSSFPRVAALEADRALVLAGIVLVQLSTGNVLVRLVLGASGTTNPLRGTSGQPAAGSLKGGRLLGPMERVFILGLGLAGDLTAASIVIAAKGLLRFPELQAARTGGPGATAEPGIHEVTEYFLVGSFVSWLVSLASLTLVAT